MESALSGEAGERAWGASPWRGELLRGVAEDTLTPWLTRPAATALRTQRAKGKFLWRWSTFPALAPPLPCRRPYTGASRWRRRMAKRAASQCRRDSEAVCAREHRSIWTWRARGCGAWSCSCDKRARGWRWAQPPSACTVLSGEPPTPAWSPFSLPTCF